MPSAASVSGTNSVSVIDAKASGKQVQSTTKHEDQPDVVGLPHRADRVVDDRRAGVRPRSAPPAIEVPEPGAEVGAAEDRVGGDADEQDDGGGGRSSDRHLVVARSAGVGSAARPVRHVALVEALAARGTGGSCRAARGSCVTPSADVERRRPRRT